MSLYRMKRTIGRLKVNNRPQPKLYREIYPYSRVSRIGFEDIFIVPRPAEPMFITDTTFRDGQQARPPYTVEQIGHIYDMLHELGGRSGLIRTCEFFIYSDKDKRAVELCRSRDHAYPKITAWIRANVNDLRLARDMGFEEVGMLTSVSDYHTYMKLGKDRKTAKSGYLEVIEQALDWGITPRCHFEDITRADIYGFCLPFAQKLMELSKQSGLPVKIRLCDTLGFGVPYQGAALPRSVPRLVRAFTDEGGVPGEWLEWHGHNDFHKSFVNAVTAWLYGCSGANGTLLGFGERTGNTPVEALVVEYVSLTGRDEMADLRVISQIGEYFEQALGYRIPDNYPFVGKDFNATSAGIHVDGLAKNEEIYNIFDTKKILGRPVPIIITDKSGRAGVSYWVNQSMKLTGDRVVDKRHPGVGKMYKRIMEAYEQGRTTSFSNQEMTALAKRYLPEIFISDFEQLKRTAHELAAHLILKLSHECRVASLGAANYPWMEEFLEEYPFIQIVYLVDPSGRRLGHAVAEAADRISYATFHEQDFTGRDWLMAPLHTGKLHITDLYKSIFTGRLCLTVAAPVTDDNDEIVAVLAADIRLEELLKRQGELEDEVHRVELV